MKFKTTAIAMAVAGTIAAPVAVQAGADEIYASARIGVWDVNEWDNNTPEVKSFSSRFGAKGETDLGNGLTGFGRYEWDVDESDFTIRHRYVGLKGDFGSVLLGQTYHTFYNFVVGPNDNPWWHSGYAMVNYRGRTDDAVTYAGSAGELNFGATIYMSPGNNDNVDQWEIGGSMGLGDLTLGVAVQGTHDGTTQGSYGSDDVIGGVSLSGLTLGTVNLGFGAQMQKDDMSFLVDAGIGNAYVHVEYLAIDKDSNCATVINSGPDTGDCDGPGDDRDQVSYTLGYTQTLGRKTTMYYELNYVDKDTNEDEDDRTAVMAVLKYDII
jgi:predicted porin